LNASSAAAAFLENGKELQMVYDAEKKLLAEAGHRIRET